ncbi:MAG TPA: hypothetical protein VF384_10635 [Planctomycetota bacterium]
MAVQDDAPRPAALTRILCDPKAWCAAVGVLAAGMVAWCTLAHVVYVYHPLPWCDYWDFVCLLPHYLSPDFRLTDLWAQHNEHRILFPRLVFLADALWFGANGVLNVLVSCLIHCGHAALMAVAVAAAMPRGPTLVVAAAAVVASLMFASQSVNLWWTFQVQFVLVYLAVTAALHQLARPQPGWWRLLAAVLLGCDR